MIRHRTLLWSFKRSFVPFTSTSSPLFLSTLTSSRRNDDDDAKQVTKGAAKNEQRDKTNDEEDIFRPEQFRVIRSRPDGNCLFRSISAWMESSNNQKHDVHKNNNWIPSYDQSKHHEVRQMTVRWMRENLETEIDGLPFKYTICLDESQSQSMSSSSIERYLRSMSMDGVWGDWSCLIALSQCLSVPIRVVFVQRDGSFVKSVVSVNPVVNVVHKENSGMNEQLESSRKIWLLYSDGLKHYDLLERKTEPLLHSKL